MGEADHDNPTDRLKLCLVTVEVVPGLSIRSVDGPGAVGDPDGEENSGKHHGETDEERNDPCEVFADINFEEAKLLVPQDVSPHIGEENEPDDGHCHDNERRRQGTSSQR